MHNAEIIVTRHDLHRLDGLLKAVSTAYRTDQEHLAKLKNELSRARIVDPKRVPGDVVTMNSRVRFRDLEEERDHVFSLVFPADADISQNRLSILAPVGAALLGYRVGDVVEWPVPSGTKRLRIEELVYQPEAAGDMHL
ncbi:MAG: nucleoside diphosphate kinase regulator [Spirochaetes bacterium]|jgi:regulator of nucleoside diphosphate kinase|nr:nucleoside diphosphate kinase regulator [Spirochaetota bacterium]